MTIGHPRQLAVMSALAITIALPVSAQHAGRAPSFDCATAKAAAERAICADQELSDLDQALAENYQAAIRALDPANAQALRTDQRAWLAERNAAFARDGYDLKREMEHRISLFGQIYRSSNEFLGEWVKHDGSVLIKDRRGGVDAEERAVMPINAPTCP